MATDNGRIEQAIDYKGSVKQDDYSEGNMTFVFPSYGYDAFLKRSGVLPQNLPAYSRFAFYSDRDWTLIRTPSHEGLWANAVATAVSKAAAWGWEVSGAVPLRRKRLQELLQYATAGVFMGYVPFIQAHLRSYLLTGKAVVEIERETTAYSSQIKALHHLNPMRCRFTDNPRIPVQYMDRNGQIHELEYYQVMFFGDQIDPTEGDMGTVESAAFRAYDRIKTLEAVHIYLYEKVTGVRPTEIEFIQGAVYNKIRDAMQSAEHEQERQGSIMYKGKVIVPVPSDIPLTSVTIPVTSVPDGFNYQEIHDNAAINYAAAIGMDVADVDPRLAQQPGIGSGAQAVVLDEKARGKGLSSWRESFAQGLHRLVAGSATTFAFSEQTLDDEVKRAGLKQTRVETRAQQIEMGEITVDQSRNMAADVGDIPAEYIEEDETETTTAGSEDNPDAESRAKEADLYVGNESNGDGRRRREERREEALELLREEWETAVQTARQIMPTVN